MNLADALTATASRQPDQAALRLDDVVLGYAELAGASARFATLLQEHGLEPGDRVGVMLPNVPHFAVVYYGVLRAGGVVVPMNPLLKSREVEYHLSDSGARIIVGLQGMAEETQAGATLAGAAAVTVDPGTFSAELAKHEPLAENLARTPDDTAVILYTSGTTGRPKGAELTHGNLRRNVEVAQGDLLRLGSDDVVFGGLPLFHSFGQTVTLNTTITAGATLLLLPRFEPAAALEQLARHSATVFAGVPTMYSALLAVPDAPALPSLRICVSGGAALPVEVLHRFEERFGCPVLEGYGLSETSPVASFNKPDQVRKPGSIGVPVSGVEMCVMDDDGNQVPDGDIGEIAIRGHNVMKGYWGKPDATTAVLSADGWFRTGDLGRRDDEGFFFIVDRLKDLVIRGGYNVYPREIEEVLYEHPDVAEAAVIGIPHDDLGEEIGAAVVLKEGSAATEDDVRDFVKDRVAAYKYPRVVWFPGVLPKGSTGKILKREIQAPAPAQVSAPVE